MTGQMGAPSLSPCVAERCGGEEVSGATFATVLPAPFVAFQTPTGYAAGPGSVLEPGPAAYLGLAWEGA